MLSDVGGSREFLGACSLALDLVGKIGTFQPREQSGTWQLPQLHTGETLGPLLRTQACALQLPPQPLHPSLGVGKFLSIQGQVDIGSQLQPALTDKPAYILRRGGEVGTWAPISLLHPEPTPPGPRTPRLSAQPSSEAWGPASFFIPCLPFGLPGRHPGVLEATPSPYSH